MCCFKGWSVKHFLWSNDIPSPQSGHTADRVAFMDKSIKFAFPRGVDCIVSVERRGHGETLKAFGGGGLLRNATGDELSS